MDDEHTGDEWLGDGAEVKVDMEDQVPLLVTPMTDVKTGEEEREEPTARSRDNIRPPTFWVRLVHFTAIIIPFSPTTGSLPAFALSGMDPLCFSLLAFLLLLSLVFALIAVGLLVCRPFIPGEVI